MVAVAVKQLMVARRGGVDESVEESECQRTYDQATELYMASFNRPEASQESVLREAHEDAVQKSLDVFNNIAVGSASTRQMYEKRLQTFLKKAFEDTLPHKNNTSPANPTTLAKDSPHELNLSNQHPNITKALPDSPLKKMKLKDA